MKKNNDVLIIAAHPDDEVLGCGGSMVKHIENGDEVHVIILAEGMTSRDINRNREGRSSDLTTLAETAKTANDIIGVTSLYLHDFPDNRMDSLDLLDVVKVIEGFIETYQPSIVYTHHRGDVNIDHTVIHDAVIAATRPQPDHCVKTVLFFETASSTEWRPAQSLSAFSPNWFVDISGRALAKKLEALDAYTTEMRAFPHARSVKALDYLAKWRGSTIDCDAAEGFMLGRQIK
jgi:LmbE family N-acetylglucosaminyl deacetylase